MGVFIKILKRRQSSKKYFLHFDRNKQVLNVDLFKWQLSGFFFFLTFTQQNKAVLPEDSISLLRCDFYFYFLCDCNFIYEEVQGHFKISTCRD